MKRSPREDWLEVATVHESRRPAPALDNLAEEWQLAFDYASRALDASWHTFAADELHTRRRRLADERVTTAAELAVLAVDLGVHDRPWLAPWPVHPSLLGLGNDVRGCVFDLDGVLTDSGLLHAEAWAEALDEFLLGFAHRSGWQFIPFDPDVDYPLYFDGRPRLEGIHLFLRGRGIRLPDAEAAYSLAQRKSDLLGRSLRHRGVNARPGARHYLEAVGRAGLGRAVVSSSTRTLPMLELAALAPLVEARVDAEQIAEGMLRSRPAPDLLLRACELLGIEPDAAVTFAHTPDGVAAGRAAGLEVVGVAADAAARERLRAFGAGRVVARLADLLEPRLAAAAAA